MNTSDIDAAEVAGRAANFAATKLFDLLAHQVAKDPFVWLGGSADPEISGPATLWAAAYVARNKDARGETLWRWAAEAGHTRPGDGWAALPLERRLAFEVFARTVRTIVDLLDAEKARARAPAAAGAATLKLEDSIFEPEESLATVRPEAKAASAWLEAHRALDAVEEGDERNVLPAEAPAPPTPLSIGEAPARPPVNRGGRGNRKERP